MPVDHAKRAAECIDDRRGREPVDMLDPDKTWAQYVAGEIQGAITAATADLRAELEKTRQQLADAEKRCDVLREAAELRGTMIKMLTPGTPGGGEDGKA